MNMDETQPIHQRAAWIGSCRLRASYKVFWAKSFFSNLHRPDITQQKMTLEDLSNNIPSGNLTWPCKIAQFVDDLLIR